MLQDAAMNRGALIVCLDLKWQLNKMSISGWPAFTVGTLIAMFRTTELQWNLHPISDIFFLPSKHNFRDIDLKFLIKTSDKLLRGFIKHDKYM